ncbi:MAG: hypothetical protein LBR21_09745 [Propionibacteriaceae bacterium]|jgi:hypothetical protein|nr:hypothetical protein [Propionibacteriaceae bacterium]
MNKGSKRLALASGVLVAALALGSAAYYTDFANLNFGSDAESGIGGDGTKVFNIQVAEFNPDGKPNADKWQEADTAEGVDVPIPGADTITPGDTITTELPFRNASAKLKSITTFKLINRTTPNGKTSDPEMLAALKFTVKLDGTIIEETGPGAVKLEDVSWNMMSREFSLGTLAPLEEHKLQFEITLPLDQAQTEEQRNATNGKVAYFQVHFDGGSDK